MPSASDVQKSLERLAMEIGEETLALYEDNFGKDWPDEESTTAALLGAVAIKAREHAARLRAAGAGGLSLRAQLTKKRDEKHNGADALIRFSCEELHWSISTTTMIQSKRHDRNVPFGMADDARLRRQLSAMLRYTPESFVMIFSRDEGIQLVPALAAASLGTPRDLFNISTLAWPQFLSGIFLGQFGEPVPARAPEVGEQWNPTWVLEIVAEMTRSVPKRLTASA